MAGEGNFCTSSVSMGTFLEILCHRKSQPNFDKVYFILGLSKNENVVCVRWFHTPKC
jgi:hypothetical protein